MNQKKAKALRRATRVLAPMKREHKHTRQFLRYFTKMHLNLKDRRRPVFYFSVARKDMTHAFVNPYRIAKRLYSRSVSATVRRTRKHIIMMTSLGVYTPFVPKI